jgi:hypothetical protein
LGSERIILIDNLSVAISASDPALCRLDCHGKARPSRRLDILIYCFRVGLGMFFMDLFLIGAIAAGIVVLITAAE